MDFAHGTTTAHAQNILDNGLSSDYASASSSGGSIGRPGSFFTYGIDGPSNPALSDAAQWGVTRNGGVRSGASVLVGRLPASTYQSLMDQGLITLRTTGEGMPEETLFHPDAFPILNEQMQWIAHLRL